MLFMNINVCYINGMKIKAEGCNLSLIPPGMVEISRPKSSPTEIAQRLEDNSWIVDNGNQNQAVQRAIRRLRSENPSVKSPGGQIGKFIRNLF